MNNVKLCIKKKYIAEGFDFDNIDDNNGSIISDTNGINGLIESRRSVLNVASKILNTNAIASFKSEYIPELKTPILYKSTKNFNMGKCGEVLKTIRYLKWLCVALNGCDWDLAHKVLKENIKVADRDLAESFYYWLPKDEKCVDEIMEGTQRFIDIANVAGYKFFNAIISYLRQHSNSVLYNYNTSLYISPDGGMFALLITNIPYCGYRTEFATEPELLMLGFTNNVKYDEAYQKTPKVK